MVIEIAGVPAEVICRYPGNERFLQDYRSDRTPVLSIRPGDADLRRIQADFDRVAVQDGMPLQVYSDAFLENNAIHGLLAEMLVAYNVLLLHGSALCMDGEAYIFTAKSGTGKSTHARLWRQVFGGQVWMVNDDKPMLRVEGGKVRVYGTPWDGKHHLSRNASAPLKAIVRLERDAENHIEPLGRADAFQTLMRHAYSSRDPQTMSRILALEKTLVEAVDFYRLGCNMEPDAARIAWAGMNEGDPRGGGFAIDG